MKLFVGLGNPGKEYEQTRHNVGFMVAEAIAKKFSIFNFQFSTKFNAEVAKGQGILLVKPQTFMNRSGEAVQKVMGFYKLHAPRFTPQDLFVIHDDLDIKLEEYKIKWGVGPKVHNGINSIRQTLGTDQFWYVRVGIDPTTPRLHGAGTDFVLSPFTKEEKPIINEVINKVADELVLRHIPDH